MAAASSKRAFRRSVASVWQCGDHHSRNGEHRQERRLCLPMMFWSMDRCWRAPQTLGGSPSSPATRRCLSSSVKVALWAAEASVPGKAALPREGPGR